MGQREVYAFLHKHRGKRYTARQIATHLRIGQINCTLAVCRLINHKFIKFEIAKLRETSDAGQVYVRTVRKVWV